MLKHRIFIFLSVGKYEKLLDRVSGLPQGMQTDQAQEQRKERSKGQDISL